MAKEISTPKAVLVYQHTGSPKARKSRFMLIVCDNELNKN